jgi:excisionase family DNA binding protein
MSETVTLHEAAERLGVHYMTAYRYVRTGALPAHKAGAVWQVDSADLDAFARRDIPKAGGAGPRARQGYPDRLVARLIVADEAGANELVDSALAGGADLEEIYLELLTPALVTIGERWADGSIHVADEHQASAIVLRLMGRVGPRFATRGRRRGTIVLGAAPGDRHGLPSSIMGDLLRARRFEVADLGADVPADGFADAAQHRDRLLAVGISATITNDEAVAEAVQAVRDAGVAAPVLVGGASIEGAEHASRLGADGYSGPGREGLATFEEVARASAEPQRPNVSGSVCRPRKVMRPL